VIAVLVRQFQRDAPGQLRQLDEQQLGRLRGLQGLYEREEYDAIIEQAVAVCKLTSKRIEVATNNLGLPDNMRALELAVGEDPQLTSALRLIRCRSDQFRSPVSREYAESVIRSVASLVVHAFRYSGPLKLTWRDKLKSFMA
jgi:hypothetical protein